MKRWRIASVVLGVCDGTERERERQKEGLDECVRQGGGKRETGSGSGFEEAGTIRKTGMEKMRRSKQRSETYSRKREKRESQTGT